MSKELVPSFEGELPHGWTIATIGDLISTEGVFIDGDWVESKDQDPNGDVRLIQLADVADGFYKDKSARFLTKEKALALNCTFLKKGDVLIARMPDPLGRACIFPGDQKESVTVVDVCVVRAGTEDVNHKWLMYWVNSPKFRNTISSLQSGTTRRRISRGNLATITFPFPPPEQQKRIVAKIEELFSHIDAGIEALKKAKQLLKQYRQSVLKAAVTGELTKEWREINKAKLEPASQLLERILKERRQKWEEQQLEQFKAKGKMPKDDKWKGKYKELPPLLGEELEGLPDLPEGWAYTRLGNVIDEPKYGTSKKCTYDNNGIGVLRIPNVANGLIDSEDLKYALFEDNEIETYRLIAGDILTIRSNGSVNLVGKCALVGDGDTDYLYAGYLIRLRPNNVLASSSYLINCLNSIYLRKQIESKAKSTSGVNNINSGELQSLIIPIGSTDEQNEVVRLVVEKIESLDRLVGEIDIQLIKSEKSKQSILSAAFSGKLVEGEADDGDAKSLLDSIKNQATDRGATLASQSTRKKRVIQKKIYTDKADLIKLIHKTFRNNSFTIDQLLAATDSDDFGELKSELFGLLKNQVEGQYRLDMQFDEKAEQYLFSLVTRSLG